MKNSKVMAGIVCGLIFSGYASLYADNAAVKTLPDGIELTIGKTGVELRVATPHAFRLRLLPLDAEAAPLSIYLSGKKEPATPYTVVHEGAAVGIKTAFGALLVNPGEETWTLRDGTGATLANWASLGMARSTPSQPAQPGKPATSRPSGTVRLWAGAAPTVDHPLYYGSGNIPTRGLLTQVGGNPQTGNGFTGLPQYWSTSGYGALIVGQADNAPGTWKAETAGVTSWTVPGDQADLYLMPARNLYDWTRDQAELTGFAPVPPRWAFGYLQSRWGWQDKAYIDDTFAHFRQDQLPVDTFIFDFEWYTTTPDYAVKAAGLPTFVDFGWNPALLPDPEKQIADLAKQGLHIVGIRKPRLGNSDNLVMAREKGWIVPFDSHDQNDGNIRSRNLDYANPAARKWWEQNNRKFLEAGMAGFWNDEGEITYTDYSYWNLAEVDLLKQIDPQARFWSLNRSFCPGVQRFGAAAWTGDIHADWATFQKTPGDLLSYGLSGMPYAACDIGGFSGNPTPELLTRWMEAGVFFPVIRSHSDHNSTPHFPWLFGPDAEAAIRKALDLRYQLIPYYYSLGHDAFATAAPLMRPLAMEFPDDEKVAGLTDEWLMGRGLLAAPILNEGGARTVYLPKDTWFNFGTTQVTSGPQTVNLTAKLDEIPLYVRAGTLLPLGPVLQYTGQASDAPLELQIYPGHDATFTFVEDDGKTLAYQTGHVRTTTFSWNEQTRTLGWKITGDYQGANLFHALKVVLFSPQGKVEKSADLDKQNSLGFN